MRVLTILAVILLLPLSACGGDDDSNGGILPVAKDVADVRFPGADLALTVPDESGPADSGPEPAAFPEDFVISFVYRGIVPGENTDKSDLYVVDSKGRNPMAPSVDMPLALTTFAIDPESCELILSKMPDGTPLSTAPCSCNLGCIVDPTLGWIVVTVEAGTQMGFGFQIGKFNEDLEVSMVKGAKFQNISDVEFAGKYLYFSQSKYCVETGCQYLVYRYNLDDLSTGADSIFLLPPDDDPDLADGQTITDGHFTASADGETVAFISPTIRSARLYVYRNGQLGELDFICPGEIQNGKCTGSGSEFSDVDPFAVSSTGKRLAYFLTTKDGLNLRLYDTDTASVQTLAMINTTGKDWGVESCNQVEASDWLFNKVSAPVFGPDDNALFFIASSKCDPVKKPYTDITRLPLSKVGTGTMGQTTIKSITKNVRAEKLANTVIENFVFSPEGSNIAYIASPMYGDDLHTELPEQSANAKKSRELWVVDVESGEKAQISFNSKYSATWLRSVELTVQNKE